MRCKVSPIATDSKSHGPTQLFPRLYHLTFFGSPFWLHRLEFTVFGPRCDDEAPKDKSEMDGWTGGLTHRPIGRATKGTQYACYTNQVYILYNIQS